MNHKQSSVNHKIGYMYLKFNEISLNFSTFRYISDSHYFIYNSHCIVSSVRAWVRRRGCIGSCWGNRGKETTEET